MLYLNSFCFFLTLSTGTLIIGVLQLVLGLFELIYKIAESTIVNAGQTSRSNPVNFENPLCSLQFVFGCYLIYGTLKGKPAYVFGSVIFQVVSTSVSAVYFGFAAFLMIQHLYPPNIEQIITETLKIPIFIYYALVVYSRFVQLTIKPLDQIRPIHRASSNLVVESMDPFEEI